MTVIMLRFRSQGKEKEAESLLRDSIHFGPYFADAYSSLASFYAEQVKNPEISDSKPCAVPVSADPPQCNCVILSHFYRNVLPKPKKCT